MIEVGIVGASGYGGGELLRLLARHPEVHVKHAISETYAGRPIAAAFPGMAKHTALTFETYGDGSQLAQCDVVFLAQENTKAMQTAPHLLEAGCKIVDLSADYRFRDPALYAQWYKTPHASPEWNDRAVYGLPELYADRIRTARLVGNPGCYPTASILALAPLLKHTLVNPTSLIIDAKSGVSGAGRSKFGLDYHYAEVNESVSAYAVGGAHRHTPEIEQALSEIARKEIVLSFTPHLIPITRGILATCYADLTSELSLADLIGLYKDFYHQAPCVVVRDEGTPATKHTYGTNDCHIGLAVDKRLKRVIVVSAIDNLVKGMAGQAIQNLNLMCGFAETAGLESGGMWP